ncbi:MAG: GNAT family N-acetyltransferase [Candidatus Thorarchaeota archaeon]
MSLKKLDLKKKRIREFFSTFALKPKHKDKKINEIRDEIFEEGMVYIQMKLPVNRITKKFADSLKAKIQHNFIHADIREAIEADLESIMNLYNKAWLTVNIPFRSITIDTLIKIFEDPDTVFLIAKVDGIDAGFVILDFEGNNNELGIIEALGVIPAFQRKGLGTILGLAAWNYFKEKDVKELRCEVYKDNDISIKFIKWIGFEEFGKNVYIREDFINEEESEYW